MGLRGSNIAKQHALSCLIFIYFAWSVVEAFSSDDISLDNDNTNNSNVHSISIFKDAEQFHSIFNTVVSEQFPMGKVTVRYIFTGDTKTLVHYYRQK